MSFLTSCTRAFSSAKLRHNFCHFSSTNHFCFSRVVHLWNSLPSIDLTKAYITIRSQISDLWSGSLSWQLRPSFSMLTTVYMPLFFLFSITSSLQPFCALLSHALITPGFTNILVLTFNMNLIDTYYILFNFIMHFSCYKANKQTNKANKQTCS